jgi:hypothetical protein
LSATLVVEAAPERRDGEASPFPLGQPVSGCRARAWHDGQPVSDAVECAADGSFALALAPGVQGPVAVEVLVPGRLRAVLEATAVADQTVELPAVALGIGSRVDGQVLDVRGRPVPEVEVQAMPNPNLDEPEPWRTTTDAEGRFVFDTLPPGPVDLQAVKPGWAISVVEAVAPEQGVLMVLGELIDLRGAVVPAPDEVARARVRLEGSSVWPPIEAPLAADGSFAFERVPDGIYGVEVIVPASVAGEPEWASVPLENLTPDLRISVALVRAHRVPVEVVDADGAPVPGARVTVGYASVGLLQRVAQADETGRARVGPLVPGPYLLTADAEGFLPSEPLELDLRDGG